jgi:hypothetical protein
VLQFGAKEIAFFRTMGALAPGKNGNLLGLSINIAYEGQRLKRNLLSPLITHLTARVGKESQECKS